MDRMKTIGSRTPLQDLTNTTSGGHQNESSSVPKELDSKERKRQRDRERWASMTPQQRHDKSKRRREARQREKGQSVVLDDTQDEFDEWLHRSEADDHYSIEVKEDVQNAADSSTGYGDQQFATDATDFLADPEAVSSTPRYGEQNSCIDFTCPSNDLLQDDYTHGYGDQNCNIDSIISPRGPLSG